MCDTGHLHKLESLYPELLLLFIRHLDCRQGMEYLEASGTANKAFQNRLQQETATVLGASMWQIWGVVQHDMSCEHCSHATWLASKLHIH